MAVRSQHAIGCIRYTHRRCTCLTERPASGGGMCASYLLAHTISARRSIIGSRAACEAAEYPQTASVQQMLRWSDHDLNTQRLTDNTLERIDDHGTIAHIDLLFREDVIDPDRRGVAIEMDECC